MNREIGLGAAKPAKLDNVQVARGVACLLLVLFHVAGGNPQDGLRLPEDSPLRMMTSVLVYIRMPIFAFISGYVYAMRPFRAGTARYFLSGKVRRLGLPLLSTTALFLSVDTLRKGQGIADAIERLPQVFLFSYEILWFLQAMLIIFFLIPLLDRLGLFQDRIRVMAFILACFILSERVEAMSFFSINGAAYLAPYFFSGYLFWRLPHLTRSQIPSLLLLLALAITLHILDVASGHRDATERSAALALIIGILTPALLISLAPGIRLLAVIGNSSFAIFLYHLLFVITCRMALHSAGITSLPTHLLLGTVAGIAGPMIVERAIVPFRWPRRILLGV